MRINAVFPCDRKLYKHTYLIRIMRFITKISKGSNFNQIYIPKDKSYEFPAGKMVEVKLLEIPLVFSHFLNISEFKEKLIKDIFAFLDNFDIKQKIVCGSFLMRKIDYRDIDVLLIVEKRNEKKENQIYEKLIEKFNLNFHVIFIEEKMFERLKEICPLTRSMLYRSVSDKQVILPKRKIDKKHLQFLLMMPEDLLKIKTNSRIFYDNIRRLIAIEFFLANKEENPEKIEKETGKIFDNIKNNEQISEKDMNILREIIKRKLKGIIEVIENRKEKKLL